MKKIRVLVVDDSAFMRKVISDILSADPAIEVVDRAKNGLECLQKIKDLQPDVVTLDIEMPVMNGLDALEQIMKTHPIPVIMLSSLTKEGADATIRALELGAVDFVTKPSGSISLDIHTVGDQIISLVKHAVLLKPRIVRVTPLLFSHETSKEMPLIQKQVKKQHLPSVQTHSCMSSVSETSRNTSVATKLVAIGTSTGGPKALQTVLTALPADFSAPIVIVQHMPPGFTKSLAQRLNTLCQIEVVEAEEGQTLRAGVAYIAPGGLHMEVHASHGSQLSIHLHKNNPRGGHRPSVDIMFESIGKLNKVQKWTVIMTGMGSDGTSGLRVMKEAGPVTSIMEDESSCVVFGMPRAAIQAGLADNVVPLEQIAETLVKLVN